MTNSEFTSLALEAGFHQVHYISFQNSTLIFLLVAYNGCMNSDSHGEAIISGYYPVSNYAYQAAKILAMKLVSYGYRAESNLQIPLKPLLIKAGIGEMGRNSLVSVQNLGSRFHIQTILTNYPFDCIQLEEKTKQLATRCISCNRCIKACPTGAIGDGMHIDESKCIRSVSEMTPPPVDFRHLMKNRLLGCDTCQDICPVNLVTVGIPSPVIELKPLLNGNIEQMKQLIGTNYARKKRLRIKAAIIAANNRRTDLIPELTEMSRSNDKDESETALWAIKELEE